MARRERKLLALGSVCGALEPLETIIGLLPETGAEAIALVGDLAGGAAGADPYRDLFRLLGAADVPVFWVPGPRDAPLGNYLREAYNMETVFPHLHGVHGSAAEGPSQLLFAGMGGEISDDPDEPRLEEQQLRYPGWEVEYRLKFLRELKERMLVFLFATPPAHKGLRRPGSEVLAELVNTYRPRLVIVAGDEPSNQFLGTALVVCPGRLERGQFALVDLGRNTTEIAREPVPAVEWKPA
jgi:Icc-related predicted phosphoesterase